LVRSGLFGIAHRRLRSGSKAVDKRDRRERFAAGVPPFDLRNT
jgi:hypothetical protein